MLTDNKKHTPVDIKFIDEENDDDYLSPFHSPSDYVQSDETRRAWMEWMIKNDQQFCRILHQAKQTKHIASGSYGAAYQFSNIGDMHEDYVVKYQEIPGDWLSIENIRNYPPFTGLASSDKNYYTQRYVDKDKDSGIVPPYGGRFSFESMVDTGRLKDRLEQNVNGIIVNENKTDKKRRVYTKSNTLVFSNVPHMETMINRIIGNLYYDKISPENINNPSVPFTLGFAPLINFGYCHGIDIPSPKSIKGYFSLMPFIKGGTFEDMYKHFNYDYKNYFRRPFAEIQATPFQYNVSATVLMLIHTLGVLQTARGIMHNDLKIDNILVDIIDRKNTVVTRKDGTQAYLNAVDDVVLSVHGSRDMEFSLPLDDVQFFPKIIDWGFSMMFDKRDDKYVFNKNVLYQLFDVGRSEDHIDSYAPNFFHPAHDILFFIGSIFRYDAFLENNLVENYSSKLVLDDGTVKPNLEEYIHLSTIFAEVNDMKRRSLQQNGLILDLAEFCCKNLKNNDRVRNFIENDNTEDMIDNPLYKRIAAISILLGIIGQSDRNVPYRYLDDVFYHVTPTSCLEYLHEKGWFVGNDENRVQAIIGNYYNDGIHDSSFN
jgi:hypothetical protein